MINKIWNYIYKLQVNDKYEEIYEMRNPETRKINGCNNK